MPPRSRAGLDGKARGGPGLIANVSAGALP